MEIHGASKYRLELSTNRIEALTDGVFAIAMTIMVLNFDLAEISPGDPDVSIHEKIFGEWPQFLHYVESFIILAFFWIKHHQQFHFIKKTDHKILWLNIFSMMLICLIPYSTSIVSDYGHLRAAVFFFEGNMLAVGVLYYWHWAYASGGHRLIEHDLDERVISNYKVTNLMIPAISVIAICLSIFSPRWGTAPYLVLPLLSILRMRTRVFDLKR